MKKQTKQTSPLSSLSDVLFNIQLLKDMERYLFYVTEQLQRENKKRALLVQQLRKLEHDITSLTTAHDKLDREIYDLKHTQYNLSQSDLLSLSSHLEPKN